MRTADSGIALGQKLRRVRTPTADPPGGCNCRPVGCGIEPSMTDLPGGVSVGRFFDAGGGRLERRATPPTMKAKSEVE